MGYKIKWLSFNNANKAELGNNSSVNKLDI